MRHFEVNRLIDVPPFLKVLYGAIGIGACKPVMNDRMSAVVADAVNINILYIIFATAILLAQFVKLCVDDPFRIEIAEIVTESSISGK